MSSILTGSTGVMPRLSQPDVPKTRARDDPGALRVLIADDHGIFRAGLRMSLESDERIGQVVEAQDFDGLMAALRHGRPDILIVDLHMPGLVLPDGLARVRRRLGDAPMLVLSASTDPDDMIRCLGAGASGYVTKASDMAVLFDAIALVLAGGIFVPADIVAGQGERIGHAGAAPPPRLTRRQAEVFELALEGHANKQIAYRLGMGEGTVKTHLAAIMRAYEVNNRVQLLRKVQSAKVKPRH